MFHKEYALNDVNTIYITLLHRTPQLLKSSSAFQQQITNFFPGFTHVQVQLDLFLATTLHYWSQ